MPESFRFFVEGVPQAQPRPRFDSKSKRAYHGKGHAKVKTWREFIAWGCWNELPDDHLLWVGPVRLDVTYFMPRPKAHHVAGKKERPLKAAAPRWHTKKPDEDNLRKAIKDALSGVLWVDDSQVCAGEMQKLYANPEERVGLEVRVELLNGEVA